MTVEVLHALQFYQLFSIDDLNGDILKITNKGNSQQLCIHKYENQVLLTFFQRH